ncbi:hypothetical protein [Arthrobacter bambusae]|uniref:hypothetical protein n=1 Tax=Arthrobacter bambusae TaxID=1338426 RepID=UPI0027867244|nr:hypothetical protein [Arthrobacter bambusae]MDQ0212647.1 hypothetical protein [Arthrobacter bambusae]MDQ0237076.1 hypothetical protein [Arthrobacter bambusae]
MKYIKSLTALALVSGAALGLAACSETTAVVSSTDAAKPVSAPTATPIPKVTSTPTQDPKKSVRGNLLMQGGDIGTISDGSTKQVDVKFSVSAITPITCDQPYARPSQNGQLVAVDVTAETTPELAQSSYPKFTLSSYDFKFIADNGTSFTGDLGTVATYSCIADSTEFPSAGMGPAEKLSGKVVLDLPAAHGILVMKSGLSGGFEYKF